VKENSYQKKQYDIRYAIENNQCKCCKINRCPATEIAHKISKSEENKKMVIRIYLGKYNKSITKSDAENVLNHNFNLVCTASRCNAMFNIGNRPATAEKLIDLIYREGNQKKTVKEINEFLELDYKK
jgi:hypothetical protein